MRGTVVILVHQLTTESVLDCSHALLGVLELRQGFIQDFFCWEEEIPPPPLCMKSCLTLEKHTVFSWSGSNYDGLAMTVTYRKEVWYIDWLISLDELWNSSGSMLDEVSISVFFGSLSLSLGCSNFGRHQTCHCSEGVLKIESQ